MTGPAVSVAPGGPWRAGVAVTRISRPSLAVSVVVSQVFEPRALPPSRRAPCGVVGTIGIVGSSARPAGSRLSKCWSCESSAASMRPIASAAMAGPVTLVHPKPGSGAARYLPPGGSKAGRG
ncbi:MAG TPA: hypothetical protein VFW71_04000 [Actinomycetota bacterium]|nr:hypothetical protein [Actinomycetota bacterium]